MMATILGQSLGRGVNASIQFRVVAGRADTQVASVPPSDVVSWNDSAIQFYLPRFGSCDGAPGSCPCALAAPPAVTCGGQSLSVLVIDASGRSQIDYSPAVDVPVFSYDPPQIKVGQSHAQRSLCALSATRPRPPLWQAVGRADKAQLALCDPISSCYGGTNGSAKICTLVPAQARRIRGDSCSAGFTSTPSLPFLRPGLCFPSAVLRHSGGLQPAGHRTVVRRLRCSGEGATSGRWKPRIELVAASPPPLLRRSSWAAGRAFSAPTPSLTSSTPRA